MTEADWAKLGITVLGFMGGLAIFLLRRIYKSIDTLFAKLDNHQKQLNLLKLAALKDDPESTALFNALTRNGDKS